MRTTLFLVVLFFFLNVKAQLNFTVTNTSNSYSITCSNPSVGLVYTSTWPTPINYSSTNTLTSLSGSNVSLTSPGVYTITAFSGTATSTQTISIYINTVAPTSTLSPVSQTLTCPNSPVTVTASSTSQQNISHYFISPLGGTITSNVNPALYTPSSSGTFTHVIVDNINGCSSSNTFI